MKYTIIHGIASGLAIGIIGFSWPLAVYCVLSYVLISMAQNGRR